jgi:hypothetical protein
MKDKQLEALIKKTVAKTGGDKGPQARFVDPTLKATKAAEEHDDETTQLFKDMKRREF